mmetsp:Transcript_15599/g.47073  ORF Transcript_15599/g.47073 Transcript_15599/m.47073 type:complete len:476 (-) Transcript_15599:190-1617(-)
MTWEGWESARRRSDEGASPNVKLLLWLTLLLRGALSLCTEDIFTAYLYMLTGSNATVGFIQAMYGMARLFWSGPAGWLADRWRQDGVIKGSTVVGAVGSAALAATVLLSGPQWMLYVSMLVLGAFEGASTPTLDAMFANSVIAGASSYLYTLKFIVSNVGDACGPLIGIVLFLFMGNNWENGACTAVVLTGLALMAIPLALMCLPSDHKCLGLPSEALLNVRTPEEYQSLADAHLTSSRRQILGTLTVPILISVSELTSFFAAGMTTKFLFLFFAEQVRLSPIAASSISVASPLTMGLASIVLQRLSLRAGRVPMILATKGLDVLLMATLACLPIQNMTGWMVVVLVAVKLTRGAVANSTRPLLSSVLMDHVPKRFRARFNALESLKWSMLSASAALGGVMIEQYGFQSTFMVSAGLKLLSALPVFPLLGMVRDDVQRDSTGHVICRAECEFETEDVHQTLLVDDPIEQSHNRVH